LLLLHKGFYINKFSTSAYLSDDGAIEGITYLSCGLTYEIPNEENKFNTLMIRLIKILITIFSLLCESFNRSKSRYFQFICFKYWVKRDLFHTNQTMERGFYQKSVWNILLKYSFNNIKRMLIKNSAFIILLQYYRIDFLSYTYGFQLSMKSFLNSCSSFTTFFTLGLTDVLK
jgi:fructose-1,6-bisphosphatase